MFKIVEMRNNLIIQKKKKKILNALVPIRLEELPEIFVNLPQIKKLFFKIYLVHVL